MPEAPPRETLDFYQGKHSERAPELTKPLICWHRQKIDQQVSFSRRPIPYS